MQGVIPVVTPDEMARIDAAAPVPVEQLMERAGAAVASAALRLLGGTYGRRVVVIAGPGNNGNDGRVAARILRRRGVAVALRSVEDASDLAPCDLVIDAAFGTGLRRPYVSPVGPGRGVLAVDIGSGIDGLTGCAVGTPAAAAATVTFAALKPGLLFAEGAELSGEIEVADIGLDVSSARIGLVETSDLGGWLVARPRQSHKWKAALWVIGGSADMAGAPVLAARGAQASGAGYVRVSSPGTRPGASTPVEAVTVPLALVGWHRGVLDDLAKIAAVVVGPGLGRNNSVRDEVSALATHADVPMVIDGDALWAISDLAGRTSDAIRVLTPHDGEYAQLTGRRPGDDRIAAARYLAAQRAAIVVLKGPTTVVANAAGDVRLMNSGDERLATAGSGDVLSGVIGALLATGMDGFDAAAAGAHLHGLAAQRCAMIGTTASDLPLRVSAVLSDLAAEARFAGVGRDRS